MAGPVSRRELIRKFVALGFEDPISGGKHPFMERKGLTVRIPNPHQGDISAPLVRRILQQAGVSQAEFERA